MQLYKPHARNLILGVVFVILVSALAMLGYMHNGWSFGDSLFMVVLTVFTVGYGEVHPLDTVELRAITITLMMLGCTGMIFLTGALFQFITLTHIQEMLGLTRMNKHIGELFDHVIICGFGRTGSMLAKELKAGRAKFVVIEPDADRVAEARELGYLAIHADAADETVLKQAGILRARALATVVSSDPVNVFITLSARALNGGIQIIARGEEPSTEKKLLQAGANSVVMSAHIGAELIASMILFPAVAGAISSPDRRRQMDLGLRAFGLEIEVVAAAEGAPFTGLSVAEIERKADNSFFIVSIERSGDGAVQEPSSDTRIMPGDGVTVLVRSGRADALDKFSDLTR